MQVCDAVFCVACTLLVLVDSASGTDSNQPPDPNDVILQAHSSSGPRPQLSIAEMQLVATQMVYGNRDGVNFLVFGCGHDSGAWLDINWRGKTVFVEDSRRWLESVKGRLSKEAARHPWRQNWDILPVQYRGQIAQREGFFRDPWLIRVTPEVDAECFDVVLVDGPAGYSPRKHGRMESSYFAMVMALRCTGNTHAMSDVHSEAPQRSVSLDVVHIFLHDAQRETEAAILHRLFGLSSDPAEDGRDTPFRRGLRMKGKHGELQHVRVLSEAARTRETLLNQAKGVGVRHTDL